MILVFSGTGNSMFVARKLSERLGDEIVTLPHPSGEPLNVSQGRVIWVMPVYSWGIPPVVRKWMKNLTLVGGDNAAHFCVLTCGDDIGNAHRMWCRDAEKRGWQSLGEWSVQMPNTYVLMKSFDVDTEDIAQKKVDAAIPRTLAIADKIADLTAGHTSGGFPMRVIDVVRGRFAWVKTAVIYPWFTRFAMSPEPFYADSRCIGCEMCAKKCPLDNISMQNGRPCWEKDCALCLRCYHICPRHAVSYTNATQGKGQSKILIDKI